MYFRYKKLQKYIDGNPTNEFMIGDKISDVPYDSYEDCINDTHNNGGDLTYSLVYNGNGLKNRYNQLMSYSRIDTIYHISYPIVEAYLSDGTSKSALFEVNNYNCLDEDISTKRCHVITSINKDEIKKLHINLEDAQFLDEFKLTQTLPKLSELKISNDSHSDIVLDNIKLYGDENNNVNLDIDSAPSGTASENCTITLNNFDVLSEKINYNYTDGISSLFWLGGTYNLPSLKMDNVKEIYGIIFYHYKSIKAPNLTLKNLELLVGSLFGQWGTSYKVEELILPKVNLNNLKIISNELAFLYLNSTYQSLQTAINIINTMNNVEMIVSSFVEFHNQDYYNDGNAIHTFTITNKFEKLVKFNDRFFNTRFINLSFPNLVLDQELNWGKGGGSTAEYLFSCKSIDAPKLSFENLTLINNLTALCHLDNPDYINLHNLKQIKNENRSSSLIEVRLDSHHCEFIDLSSYTGGLTITFNLTGSDNSVGTLYVNNRNVSLLKYLPERLKINNIVYVND